MKRIFIYALTGLLTIAFASCLRDSVVEQDSKIYLELSEEALNLSNNPDDRVIEVKTNATSWKASAPVFCDWLTLVKNSNNLLIAAQTNKSAYVREAVIVIEANGVSKEITVSQDAAESKIELSDTNLTIDRKGGQVLIKVLKSNTEWHIEGSDQYNWFSVVKAENAILINAFENNSIQKREGKIFISTATDIVEVMITQQGKDAYILPYLPSKLITKAGALQDAKDKGMFYVQGIPNERKTGFIFEFEANDGRDSKAGYEFLTGKELYSFFRLYTSNDEYGIADDFHQFLLGKGFTFLGENIVKGIIVKEYDYTTFYYSTRLTVKVDPNAKYTDLRFDMAEVQSGDIPTFGVFPYRNISLLNTADFFEVKAWEETKGGTVEVEAARTRGTKNPNVIASGQFSSLTNEQSHLVTLYFFEEVKVPYVSKLSQKMDIYTNSSFALWQNSDGKVSVTREFAEKLKKEGFEFQSRSISAGREWLTYFDIDRKLVLMIALIEQPTGERQLALSYYLLFDNDEDDSQVVALANVNKALDNYR